jgi:sugar phosphate isomerase/epimerase
MRRRDFLGAAALAPAIRAATPRADFPKEPRARLSVASYPFRAMLDPKNGKLSLLEFPKFVVETYGVAGVEPLDTHFASTDTKYLAKFRDALAGAKARVVNIPVGRIGGSFYDRDPQKRAVAIERAKHWVDVAAFVGSPSIRAHITGARGARQDAALAAESLRTVAEYGSQKNVVVHLENDDPRTEDAFFIVDIIERSGTPWLRALPDFCNSMLLGKGEEYNDRAVAAMFQHAWGICHVKDSEQDGTKFWHIDLARMFAIARKAGYQGYYSMEFDAEADPTEPTRKLIEATLRALAA